jgi:hypothetical protein
MGRLFKVHLDKADVYSCQNCGTHLSSKCQIISKAFHGRGGKAYLMESAVNVYLGPKEDRRLLTGKHEVADIFCIDCHICLGWKYISASDESQKYKEGHYILEKTRFSDK